MPRLVGPDFIGIQVDDLDIARSFYTESLGLKVAAVSPPGAVVFETKPVPFAVRKPADTQGKIDRPGEGVALWFACDDADALHDRLVAQDVAIVFAPKDGPFGRYFAFRDPFGYTITVHAAGERGE